MFRCMNAYADPNYLSSLPRTLGEELHKAPVTKESWNIILAEMVHSSLLFSYLTADLISTIAITSKNSALNVLKILNLTNYIVL